MALEDGVGLEGVLLRADEVAGAEERRQELAAVTRGSSAVVTAEEEAETLLRVFSSAMTLTTLWTRKSTET